MRWNDFFKEELKKARIWRTKSGVVRGFLKRWLFFFVVDKKWVVVLN